MFTTKNSLITQICHFHSRSICWPDSDILQHAILSLCYCRLRPNLCRFEFNSNVPKGKGSVLHLLHISHVPQPAQYHFGDEVLEWTSPLPRGIAILNWKGSMDWACDPATSVHELSRRDVCNSSLIQLAALHAINGVVSDRSITCRLKHYMTSWFFFRVARLYQPTVILVGSWRS